MSGNTITVRRDETVRFTPPATAEAVAKLTFGYAGANTVDCTDAVAMEVSGVEDGNVYLTHQAAEYLFWSLGTALGKDMDSHHHKEGD